MGQANEGCKQAFRGKRWKKSWAKLQGASDSSLRLLKLRTCHVLHARAYVKADQVFSATRFP